MIGPPRGEAAGLTRETRDAASPRVNPRWGGRVEVANGGFSLPRSARGGRAVVDGIAGGDARAGASGLVAEEREIELPELLDAIFRDVEVPGEGGDEASHQSPR